MLIPTQHCRFKDLTNAIGAVIPTFVRDLEEVWQHGSLEATERHLSDINALAEKFFAVAQELGETFQALFRECLECSRCQEIRSSFSEHALMAAIDDPFGPFVEGAGLRFEASWGNLDDKAKVEYLANFEVCLLQCLIGRLGRGSTSTTYPAISQRCR